MRGVDENSSAAALLFFFAAARADSAGRRDPSLRAAGSQQAVEPGIDKNMKSPPFRRKLKAMGGTPTQHAPEPFPARIKAALARADEVASKASLRPD